LAVAAGCGGGGNKSTTTTSTLPPPEETTTSFESTTTTVAVDPALQALLLVAADLPGFKEQTSASPSERPSTTCEAAEVPEVKAVLAAPTISGATLVKSSTDAVEVSSRALSVPREQASGGLSQLLDSKAATCLENDLRALVERDQPGGTTVTVKVATSQLTVAGADQAVVVAGTATVKADTVSRTLRAELAFLRTGGTIVVISYAGPTGLTSASERQGIIATAAGKLSGSTTSTSTAVGSGGSSTSSTRRTATTRRATTSTRRSTTTSSSSPQKVTTTTTSGSTSGSTTTA